MSSDPLKRVQCLESQLAIDLKDYRLIPYIQLHEFESLLLSQTEAFSAAFPSRDFEIEQLRGIREAFPSPEHINDGANTAPSKRICGLFSDYAKTSYGIAVAKAVGLAKMRAECRHFNSWIETLFRLSDPGSNV